jgi:4'-phosphopantetheinyl transferase
MNIQCMRPVAHGFGDAVQLWWIDLDEYGDSVRLDGLRPRERARARRMLFARHARRYLSAQHALYALLAEALGRTPGEIDLVTDEFGKPALAGAELHFNCSRSGPEALIGLGRERALGVDIECIREIVEADGLAQAHFTQTERAYLRGGANAARSERFLECWSRKEACLKALGLGLSIPLSSVEVGRAAGPRSVTVLRGVESAQLNLCSFRPSARTIAAAASVAS